jgi:phage terminase small subunit
MSTLQAEIYRVEAGRNGTQIKTHPFVAQINESWRQWRCMIGMLGLSPADERNLIPGQGDLFDGAEKYF